MGGGYSQKFTGTEGSVGEYRHLQTTLYDKMPVRTKASSEEEGVGIGAGGGGNVFSITKKKPCFCCGEFTLSMYAEYEVCSICGWIDDPYQNKNPDSVDGKNQVSLNEAQEQYSTA